jgi:hypothetical protein
MATFEEFRSPLNRLTPEQREDFRRKFQYGSAGASVDELADLYEISSRKGKRCGQLVE